MQLKQFFNPEWVLSGLKVALIVGTILFAINHGETFLKGEMSTGRWLSAFLSYLVPYSVYMFGRASSRNSFTNQDN